MIREAVTHHIPQQPDIDYLFLQLGFNAIWFTKEMWHFVDSLMDTFLFSGKL